MKAVSYLKQNTLTILGMSLVVDLFGRVYHLRMVHIKYMYLIYFHVVYKKKDFNLFEINK